MQVHSNGSKWAGEEPDSLETLIEVLRDPACILDPVFEVYGGFVEVSDGVMRAFGNFANVSHVFRIDGSPAELNEVREAIREHRRSDRYRMEFMRKYGSVQRFREIRQEAIQEQRRRKA